ncbi:MAG TPA: 50S ribosomal protein L23 [Alphaproteobacteria bacterium]|jgi:large subunit ribosomal protein L23|nr:50S ribosomal protein L23 [Alphaproteobacteria bacterium]
MTDPYGIIQRPLITEKSLAQNSEHNKVSFLVDRRANKQEIREAVERIFAVKVVAVNTVFIKGKRKRTRMREGKRPDQKKAIVTLREGDKIEFFEGL